MKALVLGAGGQLGWELQRTCPPDLSPMYCDVPKVDFFSTDSIVKCITAIRPDCIINAAAYTAVDKAEQEPAGSMPCPSPPKKSDWYMGKETPAKPLL